MYRFLFFKGKLHAERHVCMQKSFRRATVLNGIQATKNNETTTIFDKKRGTANRCLIRTIFYLHTLYATNCNASPIIFKNIYSSRLVSFSNTQPVILRRSALHGITHLSGFTIDFMFCCANLYNSEEFVFSSLFRSCLLSWIHSIAGSGLIASVYVSAS